MRLMEDWRKTGGSMSEIKYEFVKKLGSISENTKGWKKEVNLISWNDNAAKYDIRDWSPDGSKMGKGITLTNDEIKSLRDLLNQLEL